MSLRQKEGRKRGRKMANIQRRNQAKWKTGRDAAKTENIRGGRRMCCWRRMVVKVMGAKCGGEKELQLGGDNNEI